MVASIFVGLSKDEVSPLKKKKTNNSGAPGALKEGCISTGIGTSRDFMHDKMENVQLRILIRDWFVPSYFEAIINPYLSSLNRILITLLGNKAGNWGSIIQGSNRYSFHGTNGKSSKHIIYPKGW